MCASLDDKSHGPRCLLDLAVVQELANSRPVRELMECVRRPDCHVGQGILFNKTPESNGKVAWHQDLTITVQQQIDQVGFGAWTIKDGVRNVQAPADILRRHTRYAIPPR